tara:strand:+ start:1055 stop:2722 length:1668 start_codon:yes stop_codon:yes gene_type:complete
MVNILSEENQKRLEKLIINNDFSEIEKFINSLTKNEQASPFILNLLGVCKISKKVKNKETASNEAKEAQELFTKAYQSDRSFKDALYNLAEISLKTFNFDEVLIFLNNHLEKVNYDFKTVFFLARINFNLGEIEKAIYYYNKIIEKKEATKFILINQVYIYNYLNSYSQNEYNEYCKKYINSIKKIDDNKFLKLTNEKNPKKIKIGFFSTNFRNHAVMNFLLETIKNLNNEFETVAFNFTNPRYQDHITEQLKKNFTSWHDIHQLDDVAAVNLIRKNKINILFDLVGYSGGTRLELFKYRSAPIQISWIGYTNSTGLSEMDYIIADPYVLYNREYYSEKVLRLPNIWSCHELLNKEIKVNELPAKKNGYITFGSFNNFAKISDNSIILWSNLLKRINSKLILKSSSQALEISKENLIKKFEAQGIERKKIEFLKRTESHKKHLECYNKIDIALDTIPYNGATTSFESVWMGVPVMTIVGNSFTSRYGYSINKNLKLEEFVAKDEKQFLDKAEKICSNLSELDNLRAKLRNIAIESPLFNQNKFNNDFVNIIKKIL